MIDEQLYRIEAPHFVAGVVVLGGRIAEAAPIVRWAVGKSLYQLQAYCRRKGWTIAEVQP